MMKKTAVFLPVLVLFFACAAWVTEPTEPNASGCPADRAAASGMDILGDLHKVMAPAWHEAYPAKNYSALNDAVIKFDVMLPKVKDLKHTFKTPERQKKFEAARTRFIGLTAKAKATGEAGDNDALYALIPDLHTSFEEMAYYLLPLNFPEYESFRVVVDLMIDTHLKNKDYKAISSSVEALKIKNDQLQKAALPEDLKSVAEKATADITAIGEACKELETACGATTVTKVDECLEKLKKACDKFEQDYI